jgi:hypothetical protein
MGGVMDVTWRDGWRGRIMDPHLARPATIMQRKPRPWEAP